MTHNAFLYSAWFLGALMILAAILLSGCVVTAVTERPYTYSRYEIDAINAETACRALARNIIQMERCTIRGR
jgi:hypothetical protein